ncbi:hypothetical protein FACS189428_1170 [Clostridia bacterium]|nr:hypothetical protein FACS189428_1170 [Clostridia bacterium]
MEKTCNCDTFTHFDFYHKQDKKIICKEKRSKYTYENRSLDQITKYRVDGNLISEGKKCDFLLLNCEKKKAYFIELKGSDLHQAIDQITTTIDMLKNSLSDFTICARIVLTRVNSTCLEDLKYKTLKKKVKELNGGDLKQESNQLIEINN